MAQIKRSKRQNEEDKQIAALRPYWALGTSLGCPVDQMTNFTKGAWVGQPKQLEMAAAARKCDHRCPECQALWESGKPIKEHCRDCGPTAIGVGGARAGGKSNWMSAQVWLDDSQRFAGLKVLYLRKTAKALREQIRDLLKKTFPMHTAENPCFNYREQVGEIKFPNGSFTIIGHFKDESEIDNYLGQEYDVIAIEELTTLTFDKFKNLMSCLRSSKGWRPRCYAAWNWGGLGHGWVKQVFYDVWKEGREIETRYILALVQDNRHNNPEYVNQLRSYVGWKYQSWYLGDPNFAAGNYFQNFREDVHVYPNSQTQLDESKIVRWFGSMDYGASHPNCFHLHCEDANGDFFTVGESHTVGNTISENAEEFKDLLRLKNLEVHDLDFIACGHDCFKTDRKTRNDGSVVATEFEENGVQLVPYSINRINTFSQMQERLGNVERGIRPSWFIHRNCPNLINQIQTAQCDPKKPNDVLKMNADAETGEGGDDALDSAAKGIGMAYSSLLTGAKPIKMGSYQPLSSLATSHQILDIQAEIEQAELEDAELK